jgi:hypothetical protein
MLISIVLFATAMALWKSSFLLLPIPIFSLSTGAGLETTNLCMPL